MIYRLIVQAYPHSFRQEFGESMIQTFADSLRDVQRKPTGLPAFWMRTLVDAVRSLARVYAGEIGDPMWRLTLGMSIVSLVALGTVVAFGGMAFSEFYAPPAFSSFRAPGMDEDVLYSAYEQALAGDFGRYLMFVRTGGVSVAALLGVATGLFGLSHRSFSHGVMALLGGMALTVAAFELLPTIWFPLDRYPAGALWLMRGGALVALGAWLLITVAGTCTRAFARHIPS